jgi:hypothetical protein
MLLKTKLSLGLGFLFVIIFSLVFFSSYNIGKLSLESDNILKDNYNSLVYSKNMINALEDIRNSVTGGFFNLKDNKQLTEYYDKLFDTGKNEFETNLNAENNNITELHEKEYVDMLNNNYVMFLNLCALIKKEPKNYPLFYDEFLSIYEKLRRSINDINDINMKAVVSQIAKNESKKNIIFIAIIGSFCIILAFGYFWYFPFYISNSISYLSHKMQELLKKMGIEFDIKTNDETFVILHLINLLENKFSIKTDDKDQK